MRALMLPAVVVRILLVAADPGGRAPGPRFTLLHLMLLAGSGCRAGGRRAARLLLPFREESSQRWSVQPLAHRPSPPPKQATTGPDARARATLRRPSASGPLFSTFVPPPSTPHQRLTQALQVLDPSAPWPPSGSTWLTPSHSYVMTYCAQSSSPGCSSYSNCTPRLSLPQQHHRPSASPTSDRKWSSSCRSRHPCGYPSVRTASPRIQDGRSADGAHLLADEAAPGLDRVGQFQNVNVVVLACAYRNPIKPTHQKGLARARDQ